MPKVERMYEEGGGVSTICTYQQNSCESVIFFVCVSNRHTILSEKMAENCSVWPEMFEWIIGQTYRAR